jgi:hypothetical protein
VLDFLLILAIVTAVVALGAAGRAIAISRASVPTQVIRALDTIRDRIDAAEANLAAHDARALQWRTEMEGLIEAAETVLDRVERKRRSAAAAAAKINAAQGDGPAAGSDADIWAKAREQGLL